MEFEIWKGYECKDSVRGWYWLVMVQKQGVFGRIYVVLKIALDTKNTFEIKKNS